MSDPLKKHLTTQLELLDESSFHLQSSISDFIQQIKTSAMKCVDKTSDSNMTVKDAISMVATAQSTIIDHTYMLVESTKLYPPTVVTGEKATPEKKTECDANAIERVKNIETTLTSLQDTKQKTEDDISEMKQWRDNFVTEHNDMVVKTKTLSEKQKQNLKNMRKQLHEQESKIEEMNKVIENFKEKESTTNKKLEELSLDLKEHEKNLHKINKEIQNHTDKTEYLTQGIQRRSDLISTTQEKLLSKHGVICQLLQQRLLPIYRILQASNRNLETTKEKLEKNESLEKDVLKLSNDFQTIANQQVKHSTPWFVASHGRWDGKYYDGYKVITFSTVERNVGNHFDPNTGVFTAPVDGLYKAGLTIKQTGDRDVGAWVVHKSGRAVRRVGNVETKKKCFEASTTFEVYMKAGDVLFSFTGYHDCECTHFSCVYLDV
ncbi:uncharacterized protein LOC131957609 isoform X2 [Physella acuta]|uniref:uncharacterized protein LOC131957609 isoform X2 n=1 Tax=Physella acuta TaxID=109671 RepID=UPI0027DB3E7E|nr:uncharacterized protein LOC131957609 isoform X2 [Physella acuta]